MDIENTRDAWKLVPGGVMAALGDRTPTDQAVKWLDGIPSDDPEAAHGKADDILLLAVAPEVREAYQRVVARCDWWANA